MTQLESYTAGSANGLYVLDVVIINGRIMFRVISFDDCQADEINISESLDELGAILRTAAIKPDEVANLLAKPFVLEHSDGVTLNVRIDEGNEGDLLISIERQKDSVTAYMDLDTCFDRMVLVILAAHIEALSIWSKHD